MIDIEERLTNDLHAAANDAGLGRLDRNRIAQSVQQRRRRRRTRYLGGLAAAAAVAAILGFQLAAHDGDGVKTSDPATTVDEDRVDPDTPETTTAPDPSTTPPTTAPVTTTTAPPATEPTEQDGATAPPVLAGSGDVVLAGDGFGAFDFGAPMDGVVAGLTEELGPLIRDTSVLALDEGTDCAQAGCDLPTTSTLVECPTAGAPDDVGRIVQWNGLAVVFLGESRATMELRGWSAGSGSDITTALGVSLNDPHDAWRDGYPGASFVEFAGGRRGIWVGDVTIPLPGGAVRGWYGDSPDMQLQAGEDCGLGDG